MTKLTDQYVHFITSVYCRPFEINIKTDKIPQITEFLDEKTLEIDLKEINLDNFDILKIFEKNYTKMVPSFFEYPIKICIIENQNYLKEVKNVYYFSLSHKNKEDRIVEKEDRRIIEKEDSNIIEENLSKILFFEKEKMEEFLKTEKTFLKTFFIKKKLEFYQIYLNIENIKNTKHLEVENPEMKFLKYIFKGLEFKNMNEFLEFFEIYDTTKNDDLRIFLLLSNNFNLVLLEVLKNFKGKILVILMLQILKLLENDPKYFHTSQFFAIQVLKFYLKKISEENYFNISDVSYIFNFLERLIGKFHLENSVYYFQYILFKSIDEAVTFFESSDNSFKRKCIEVVYNLDLKNSIFLRLSMRNITILDKNNKNSKNICLKINFLDKEIINKGEIKVENINKTDISLTIHEDVFDIKSYEEIKIENILFSFKNFKVNFIQK